MLAVAMLVILLWPLPWLLVSTCGVAGSSSFLMQLRLRGSCCTLALALALALLLLAPAWSCVERGRERSRGSAWLSPSESSSVLTMRSPEADRSSGVGDDEGEGGGEGSGPLAALSPGLELRVGAQSWGSEQGGGSWLGLASEIAC